MDLTALLPNMSVENKTEPTLISLDYLHQADPGALSGWWEVQILFLVDKEQHKLIFSHLCAIHRCAQKSSIHRCAQKSSITSGLRRHVQDTV